MNKILQNHSLIYLVGMPASGKTTFGKKLASKIGYDFVDLDQIIINQEKQNITDIFENKGEDYFRIVERDTLHLTNSFIKTVIATGGGAPCFFNNMDFINKNGLSIWLNVSIESLAMRIMQGESERPMFKNKNRNEIIEFLQLKLSEREPFYQKAKLKLESENIDIDELLLLI